MEKEATYIAITSSKFAPTCKECWIHCVDREVIPEFKENEYGEFIF